MIAGLQGELEAAKQLAFTAQQQCSEQQLILSTLKKELERTNVEKVELQARPRLMHRF